MSDQGGVSIENLGDDLYEKTMELVSFLMALDPAAGTREGDLLNDMADAVIKYEAAKLGKDWLPK